MHELPEVKLVPADGRDVPGETKFGGRPTIIQGHRPPECCGVTMQLFVQVDGLDFPEAELPDSALVYLYLCRQCFGVSAHLESM
jgi:hypothetical protein